MPIIIRIALLVFIVTIFWKKKSMHNANGVDPDQSLRSAASDLDRHIVNAL